MGRLKKLKKIRIHREGTHTLAGSLLLILAVNAGFYFGLECKIPFYVAAVISLVVYGILVNFFRCPIRLFGQEDTEKIVVAPADGKIVVVEEVEETEYFHDRRIMVSIFMSLVNVHANWYPVDGTVKLVSHQNGKFMKAWLPKASTDNERSTVVIETPEGVEIMARRLPEPWHAASSPTPNRVKNVISTNIWDSSSSVPAWMYSSHWVRKFS